MTNRVENAKDLTAEQVREIAAIVRIAIAEPCEFIPLNGCGRVYMHIGYSKIMKGYAIAKALNNVGPIRVTQRPGEKGYTFYMGYDNAHGRVHSVANHIAKRLKDAGYIAVVLDWDRVIMTREIKHHETVFIDDRIHDWDFDKGAGELRYYSHALPSAIMAESCGDDVERMPIIVIYEFEQ